MSRSFFRSRRILTTALVTLPALAMFGACSSSSGVPAIQANPPGFGDGSTAPLKDATTDTGTVVVTHLDARPKDAHVAAEASDAPTDVALDSSAVVNCTSDEGCPLSHICATAPVVIYDGGVVVDAGKRPNCADAGAKCVCQPRTCTDGVQVPPETGIDCGNTEASGCPRCPTGQGCGRGSDCLSGVCGTIFAGAACAGADGGAADTGACVCTATSCDDGVLNGEETDVDCGGPICHGCNTGKSCLTNTDCNSEICTTNVPGTSGPVCTCPTTMVEVTTSKGAPYCIDQYEVTFGEYQTFLNKNVDPASQPAECLPWNTSFAEQGLVVVPGTATEVNPVTNVNWCDAYMYCKTFNKHLCGSTFTVGSPTPYNSTAENDSTQDEWYNACSTQGSNKYTYGNVYLPDACNTSDSILQCTSAATCNEVDNATPFVNSDGIPCIFDTTHMCNSVTQYFSWAAQQDVSCYVLPLSGGTSPSCNDVAHSNTCHNMAGIFDMTGNVWEWENSCGGFTTGDAGSQDSCLVRGGAFNSPDPLNSNTCAVSAAQPPLPRNAVQAESTYNEKNEDVGIRCCL